MGFGSILFKDERNRIDENVIKIKQFEFYMEGLIW